MEYDLHSHVKGVVGLALASITTNTNTDGVIIDTQGFNSGELFVQSHTLTDGDYAVEIWGGDDAALADGVKVTDLIGAAPAFAAADDNAVKRLGTYDKYRYYRIRIVSTNVTTGGNFSALWVLSNPLSAPVADQS